MSPAADMATPGLFVLTDRRDPGWRAYLYGKPVTLVCVNRAMRGVVAPAGEGPEERLPLVQAVETAPPEEVMTRRAAASQKGDNGQKKKGDAKSTHYGVQTGENRPILHRKSR